MQRYVTQQAGTEPHLVVNYCITVKEGVYECLCCGSPLFMSETKLMQVVVAVFTNPSMKRQSNTLRISLMDAPH